MHTNKGFTLIELMIATAIIAIIAAVALPAYNGYITTGRQSECQHEAGTIKLAQEEHYLENNTYFAGTRDSGANSLSAASTYYDGVYSADDNCSYTVAAGPTGSITSSYTITATGINELAGEGTIVTYDSQ